VAGKPTSTVPPARIAAYDRVIATVPGPERKGATVPYTSVNGHMTSYLDAGGGLALRLPPAERQRFLDRYGASLQVACGAPNRSSSPFPVRSSTTPELAPWFAAGYAWMAASPRSPRPASRRARRRG